MKVYSIDEKHRALTNVKRMVEKGNSLSKARILVGRMLGVTPNTLYNWERRLNGTVTSTVLHTNNVTPSLITSVNIKTTKGVTIQLTPDDINNIAKLAGHIH